MQPPDSPIAWQVASTLLVLFDDVIAVALLLRMRLLISIQILLLLLPLAAARPAGCRREDKSSLPPLTYSAFSFRRLEVERIVQAAAMSLGRSKSFGTK